MFNTVLKKSIAFGSAFFCPAFALNLSNIVEFLFEADVFESWVFETVLPSIRKTGSYNLGKETKIELPKKKIAKQLQSIK